MGEKQRKKLLLLYASQTGNALDAAEHIGREAEHRGCPASIVSIDEFDPVCVKNLFDFNSFLLSSVDCLLPLSVA